MLVVKGEKKKSKELWDLPVQPLDNEGNHLYMRAQSLSGDPMDCGPPGSSVHGILQARILEWDAMPSSRDQTQVSCTGRRILYRWTTREAQNHLYLFTITEYQTAWLTQQKFIVILEARSPRPSYQKVWFPHRHLSSAGRGPFSSASSHVLFSVCIFPGGGGSFSYENTSHTGSGLHY